MNLRKNLSLKLLAIILAFVSWVWVESQGDLLKTIETTVDLVGLPLNMEVVGAMPSVSVQLRGPEPTLRTLPPERVVVKVDAAGGCMYRPVARWSGSPRVSWRSTWSGPWPARCRWSRSSRVSRPRAMR